MDHFRSNSMIFEQINIPKFIYLNSVDAHTGRKAATLVCESKKLAFAYFALVSLTSVHKIQKITPKMAPGISGSP